MSTRIAYALPAAAHVRLSVLDVLGREVAVLADGARAAGRHEATLLSAGLASGIYVVRLSTGDATLVRRVTRTR